MVRISLLLLLLATMLFGEGGLPGAFLNYGPAPRSLGMGKAFTAVADDAQAIYFNPAGLIQLNAHEVLAAHSQLFGARMEYLAYVLPTRALGSFGIGILNYGAEGIDSRTPENWQYLPTVYAENAYQVAYAYAPVDFLGIGGSIKLITKNLAQYLDAGIGMDAGIAVRRLGPFSFGLTVQNLVQPVLTLHTLSDRYPRTLRAGAAARLLDGRAIITVDVAAPLLPKLDTAGNPTRSWQPVFQPHGGVEFQLIPDVLIHRVGYDRNEISLGLGVHQSWGRMGIGVDYAFLLHHQSSFRLAPTHKLGMFVNFGGFRVWIDAQPRVFTPTPGDKNNVLWLDVHAIARNPVRRWQVLIKNSFGEVIRSYSGWDEPPARLLWDGLDDAGRLAADGRYYYEIVIIDQRNSALTGRGYLTTVQTRGPQGRVEITPGQ